MMRQIRVALSAVAIACGAYTDAHAAQLGHYVGVAYGSTDKQDDRSTYDAFTFDVLYRGISFAADGHTVKFDTRDQGFAGFLGFRLNRYLAIEGIYIDSGKVEYRAQSSGTVQYFSNSTGLPESGPMSVDTRLESRMIGYGMQALGILPFADRWEAFGRAGFQYSSIRTKGFLYKTSGPDEVLSRMGAAIARDGTVDWTAGLGMAMSIADTYGVRLEYMRIFKAGSDLVAKGDADILMLGVIVAF